MNIEKNKVVSVIYELRTDDAKGEVIESLTEDKPLSFIFGTGALLPKFEENISNKKVGDTFDFQLECIDAYGLAIEDAVVDIPKSVFEVEGEIDHEMLQEGNAIPMMDNSGNRLNGVVVSVSDDTIKMDFNHPLAGDDLHFKGKIVEVREATAEELQKGHIGGGCGCGSGGCDDGGCGSGGCGSDDCGCDDEKSDKSSCGCGCN